MSGAILDELHEHTTAALYPRVLAFIRDYPWAILPGALDTIVEVVRLRATGARFSDQEIQARIGAQRERGGARVVGRVQVIPVYGVIAHRMNSFDAISGGCSTELLGATITQALNDPAIGAIALDVDSPGGNVLGVQELADLIFASRGRKPIVAVANATCASAAYWIACQADEVVVTPSGQVGSIGVLAIHEDLTGAAAQAGVKVSYISAGRFKTEGQPFAALTDEARAAMQGRVDEHYAAFVRSVARGRTVAEREVRHGFGEGRMVSAPTALELGMADRIETLDQAIARLERGPRATTVARAGRGSMKAEGDEKKPMHEDEMEKLRKENEALKAKLDELEKKPDDKKPEDEKAAAAVAALQSELQAKGAALDTLLEERRQDRIRGKADSVKLPVLRPFFQALYDLATRIQGAAAPTVSVVIAGTPQALTAEAVLDKFVAEVNAKSALLFAGMSVDDTEKAQAALDAATNDPGIELDRRTKEYMTAHAGTDYRAARDAVLAADPALKAAYARS